MIELTVTTRGHRNDWLLCELRSNAALVAKVCAPACLIVVLTEALDKNFHAKSLIPLKDSDASLLLSRQEKKK